MHYTIKTTIKKFTPIAKQQFRLLLCNTEYDLQELYTACSEK